MADEIPTEALQAAALARLQHVAQSHAYHLPPAKRPVVDGEERSTGWYWKCTCGAGPEEMDFGSGYACRDEAIAHENEAVVRAAAPYLIAEGRRQAAAAIRAASEREEQPLVRLRNGNLVRTFEVPEWAARIAEGARP